MWGIVEMDEYDYDRWFDYQRELANAMGVDLDASGPESE
jgi:hypothetical protein